nr:MAG TPA: hypothetical protein [Caudoviricetes sp.]
MRSSGHKPSSRDGRPRHWRGRATSPRGHSAARNAGHRQVALAHVD